jgi:methionyl-tRNA formyltransferase
MTATAPVRSQDGPLRTVFLGSGAFAVPILDELVAHPLVRVVGVVSAPDRPAGRGGAPTPVPVARRAAERSLPLLQPARIRDEDAIGAFRALAPDLGVLADYGRLVPPAILGIPAHGILNVHPSLLPRHRGATPVPATILAGDPVAGVTLFLMDEGLDTGPLVASASWPLAGDETTPLLEARAAAEGAALLRATLGDYLAGRLVPRPQPELGVTLTRPFRREDGRIDPALTLRTIERRVRALEPWPGSFVETAAGRLLIRRVGTQPFPDGDAPRAGSLVALGRRLALAVADGLLLLEEVRLAGRAAMSGEELLRGQPGLAGTRIVG